MSLITRMCAPQRLPGPEMEVLVVQALEAADMLDGCMELEKVCFCGRFCGRFYGRFLTCSFQPVGLFSVGFTVQAGDGCSGEHNLLHAPALRIALVPRFFLQQLGWL